MRRLAKLLFVQNLNPDIKQLIHLLKPHYFRRIVDDINKIAMYNSKTEQYEFFTLAINLGTLIIKCCDPAYIQLL